MCQKAWHAKPRFKSLHDAVANQAPEVWLSLDGVISKPGRLDEFTGQGSGAYKDPTKVHLEPTRILSLL